MKVFVAGSSGRVGLKTLEKLVEAGHTVTAGARKPERLPVMDGMTPVDFDLTLSVDEMARAVKGHAAIIVTAGSAGKSLLQIDLFGMTQLMQASEKAGVKRFVLLSSIFALEPERWVGPGFEQLKDYYIAKYFADLYLTEQTSLDYTILQPGSLKEEAGTGQISLNDSQSAPAHIEDVAETLTAILNHPNTIGKVLGMHTGGEAISEALKAQ
ncbi:SDR family oxidoreductase [Lactococcus termiticola]|uniref:Oxidoreductase n=1 Tax=Lactococcus termiticola TaxID=2169526 RepID=A0A2R5HH55_9LACT|nr:SDR family oxidoreductase [Lactococcus termiticola]GBG97186.1 oxidoreductase [Lactococcus termiticola]